MKLSKLSKTSILLFICYGVDKCVAILRQLIIARQFGLSVELDVFNIANNLPDMLFTLISGGALSMALIPVMTDIIERGGRKAGWKLFSSIANLAFITAAVLSVFIAVFAKPIVKSEIGIAPGFTAEQQSLVTELMRLNLIATLIFSLSGLVMGGLQANRHFLMPALAPIFYNLGQIFGALVMAPSVPYRFGPITLPCMGLGIHGLVYGVILGAGLHLLVQVPALIRYNFCWRPVIRTQDADVRRVRRFGQQNFLVLLSSDSGNCVLGISDVYGNTYLNRDQYQTSYNMYLPSTATYYVDVYNYGPSQNFSLQVFIPARVTIPYGATSTVYNGSIGAYGVVSYTAYMYAGQTARIDCYSGSQPTSYRPSLKV